MRVIDVLQMQPSIKILSHVRLGFENNRKIGIRNRAVLAPILIPIYFNK